MKSQLLLPKLDKDIALFIEQNPSDPFIHPAYDRIYKVGIKYFGFIYRKIECDSLRESEKLINFLLDTGYVRKDFPEKGYDTILEIID